MTQKPLPVNFLGSFNEHSQNPLKISLFKSLCTSWLSRDTKASRQMSVKHSCPPPAQNGPERLEVCAGFEETSELQRSVPAELELPRAVPSVPQPLGSTQHPASPSQGWRAAPMAQAEPWDSTLCLFGQLLGSALCGAY